MKNKYYQFIKNENSTDLYIYGDITSQPYFEGEISASTIIEELNNIDSDELNVYISSYGGECKEGLAIYSALKRHKAKVTTYCDGFACSIASVIFMAGDERIMDKGSLLMIHNAWSSMQGNAEELRKQADTLDIITQSSINAYMEHLNISEKELKKLLDEETWLDCYKSLEMGFATKIVESKPHSYSYQSAKDTILKMIKGNEVLQMQEPNQVIEVDEVKEEVVVEDPAQVEEVLEIEESPQTETIEDTTEEVVEEVVEENIEIEKEEGTIDMKLNENKNINEMEIMEMDRERSIREERGQRRLTVAEEKFYDRFVQSAKTRNPRQAFIELEGNEETAMPETIMEDVFKDMLETHQLLNAVNGVYTGYATKWILNDHEKQSAVWGEIDGEITKEITGAFRTIDIKQHKLSAFAQIPMGILDLGKTFIDAYIRKALADSIATALEAAIVNGDGKNCPVGLMKNLTGALDGVHQDKEATVVKELSPKVMNEVVAKISKTSKGHVRNVAKVQMIVNNVDYLTKVLPAIQTLNMEGRYVAELPFPTDIIVCNEVPSGKAIVCKLDEYFLGLASGKDGVIEFSDDYKFVEDKRTFKVKIYATGTPKDDNMAQVLDISGLTEKVVKTKQA